VAFPVMPLFALGWCLAILQNLATSSHLLNVDDMIVTLSNSEFSSASTMFVWQWRFR